MSRPRWKPELQITSGRLKKLPYCSLDFLMGGIQSSTNSSMTKHLFIGGLVAAGCDPACAYMLTVSHSGRGVFSTTSWERVARDSQLAYPEGGRAIGIGPINGISIPVSEIDYKTGHLSFPSPDGKLRFEYEEGTLTISTTHAEPT
jgi:hypothetical protein